MAKKDDPQYVRLAYRLSNGMACDVGGSGWSIAGLDVRKFPEDKEAARYVRGLLRDGALDPCGKAEWEEAHVNEVGDEVLAQRPDFRQEAAKFQEAHVQRAAAAGARRIKEARDAELDDDDEEELAQDRADRLQQQEDDGLDDDDPEEQIARSNPTRKTKSTKKKGKKSKAKAAAAAE